MNKLQQLIQQLCPNGVEYKPLGDKHVSIMQRGTSLTRNNSTEGIYPVISGGKVPAFYCNLYNRKGETITVAGSGAGAGYVQYWNEPIFVCDAFSVKGCDNISTKYLYYCLNNMQDKIYATKKGGGVPHVHISSIDKFLIPIPPLPVQEEIVRILDKFSLLSAELEAELELRKKQYDFYRNRLLSFDSGPTSNTDESSSTGITYHKGYYPLLVKWKKLGEIFEMRNGYTPSKNNPSFWENGTIPWFRMDDIRENGRILSDSIQHITSMAVKGKGLFEAGSFILATTATIGEHALLIADSLANQQFTNLKIHKSLQNSLLTKFVFYYMFVVDDYCKTHTHKSGFESVDMDALRKMPFPIPSIEEQERIVKILDRFESLVNDLSQGLPAEIAAVQQQYEYYRNKLLTFPRKDIA